MTPEEEQIINAMIEQGLIMDPFNAAANQFGQGSDYLYEEDTPTPWDRMGDKDDLLGDMLKRTGLYFEDLVDLPYEQVEDPGEFDGYVDYDASLYQGNLAYETVKDAVAAGMSFEEAVNKVAKAAVDPEDPDAPALAAAMPRDRDGKPDYDAFRSSAADAVAGGAGGAAELSAYEAERQAYEDYIRPRTGLDYAEIMPEDEFKRTILQPTSLDAGGVPVNAQDPNAVIGNALGRAAGTIGFGGRPPTLADQRVNDPRRTTVTPNYGARNPVTRDDVDMQTMRLTPAAESARQARMNPPSGSRRRTSGRRGSGRSNQSEISRMNKDRSGRTSTEITFDKNKERNKAMEFHRRKAIERLESQQRMSKADENKAKLIAAYNQFMYGGNA